MSVDEKSALNLLGHKEFRLRHRNLGARENRRRRPPPKSVTVRVFQVGALVNSPLRINSREDIHRGRGFLVASPENPLEELGGRLVKIHLLRRSLRNLRANLSGPLFRVCQQPGFDLVDGKVLTKSLPVFLWNQGANMGPASLDLLLNRAVLRKLDPTNRNPVEIDQAEHKVRSSVIQI